MRYCELLIMILKQGSVQSLYDLSARSLSSGRIITVVNVGDHNWDGKHTDNLNLTVTS